MFLALHVLHLLLHFTQFTLCHTRNLEYRDHKPEDEPGNENKYNSREYYPENHITKGMQTHVNENIIAYEIKTVVVTNKKFTYFCIGKS